MSILSTLLAAALALAVAPPGPARPAAPPAAAQQGPPPPAPALDVEPFRFLVGHWRGQGTFFDGKPVSSELSFELASRTTLVMRGAEDPPNTYRYIGLWSREKESGELLMLLSSSLDGPALYRSAGWVGDRLAFEPRPGVNTGPSRVRFTYVRKGPAVLEQTYEFSTGDKWLVGDRQTFTKVE